MDIFIGLNIKLALSMAGKNLVQNPSIGARCEMTASVARALKEVTPFLPRRGISSLHAENIYSENFWSTFTQCLSKHFLRGWIEPHVR